MARRADCRRQSVIQKFGAKVLDRFAALAMTNQQLIARVHGEHSEAIEACADARTRIAHVVTLHPLIGIGGRFPEPVGASSGTLNTCRRSSQCTARWLEILSCPVKDQACTMRGSQFRGVAQSGRALRSGRRGRRFESCLPDQSRLQKQNRLKAGFVVFRLLRS